MILSIVTVVKDDLDGLVQTCSSIDQYVDGREFEHIIWWNQDTELSKCMIPAGNNRKVVTGKDGGIFDAMNKAITLCSADYVLFLNARDTFEQQFHLSDLKKISGPCLLRVQYVDFFGQDKSVSIKKSLKMGIPYCHQGMILERAKLKFPTDQTFGGDYVALLNCQYNWPLDLVPSGQIRYDTAGISSRQRWRSDMETNRIIGQKFGLFWRAIHFIRSGMKMVVKKIYGLIQ